MRLPTTLLSLVYLAVSPCLVNAGPLAPKDTDEQSWNNRLMKQIFGRQGNCAGTLCGYYNQYCCVGGEKCYTDLQTIAHCSTVVPAQTLGSNYQSLAAAQWSYSTYTTTNQYVITVTTSYYMGVAPATSLTASTAVCSAGAGCGAVCCDLSYQTCGATMGQCVNIATATGSYSAPLRGTSSGTQTTASATTTETFAPAIGTSGSTFVPIAESSNKGLSAGTIAGIVIGVIVGVIILLTICFCCILKAGFDGILSLLGLRNRRSSERTEVIEETYSRHGGSASRRDTHGGWFGGNGGGTRIVEKKSGLAGEAGVMVGIAAALAGLWAVLGLKKRKSGRSDASDVSYTTYTESYTATSASSASSDRRTRDSRRVSRPPRSAR